MSKETLRLELSPEAMERVRFEAGRLGLGIEEYAESVLLAEVGTMPRWSFEIAFDGQKAAGFDTSAEELYAAVASIAEASGNARIGRGAWMAADGADAFLAQPVTISRLRRAPRIVECASRWVAREDGQDVEDLLAEC